MDALPAAADGNTTTVRCPQCVEQYLQPTYPQWRRHLGLSIFIIHAILVVISVIFTCTHFKLLRKRGRDYHLLVLLAIGVTAASHTAIREIIGEAKYPCIAHFVLSFVTNAFGVATVTVRQLRLIALHRVQRRMQRIMSTVQMELDAFRQQGSRILKEDMESGYDGLLGSKGSLAGCAGPGEQAYEEQGGSDAPQHALTDTATAGADTQAAQVTCNNANEACWRPTGSAEGKGHSGLAQEGQARPHSAAQQADMDAAAVLRAIPRSTGCNIRSRAQVLDCILLDVLHLHQVGGQLCVWAAVAVVMGITPIRRAITSPKDFQIGQNGCYYSGDASQQGIMIALAWVLIQAAGLAYTRKHADAFSVHREVAAVTVIAILAVLLISFVRFFDFYGALEVFPPNYFGTFASWFVLYVAFISPSTAIFRQERKVHSFPLDIYSIENISSAYQRSRHATLPLGVGQSSVVNYCGGGAGIAGEQSSARPPVQDTWGALDEHGSHFFGMLHGREDIGRRGSWQPISSNIMNLLRRSPEIYDHVDSELLTACLCSCALGRRHLKRYLATEWCVELLLFLLDAACVYARCDVAQHHHKRVFKAIADAEEGSAHPLALDDVSIQSLIAVTDVAAASAQHLAAFFVSPSASMPIELSSRTRSELIAAVACLQQEWAVSRSQVSAGQPCGLMALRNLMACCEAAEREIFAMLAYGPVMRFATTAAFVRFKREYCGAGKRAVTA